MPHAPHLQSPESEPLNPTIFEDPDFQEVFTTINMRCEVSSYEHDFDHPENPIIHFKGATQDQSQIHGSVRLTLENHIRYHFVSTVCSVLSESWVAQR